ncbi:SDR family NAD(P)-dependent oxidoreductase [Allorhodopirellula solitaria]|uniref:2-(R)-hydroxypropyl-CoM dehydrogenase n=1 Tax=Allorhodopirellula solitaria TaxID=2527987 RepID=A0A5C5XSH1_9BACT|nr:SDR family oxidoreductase [Allorhodopirellula solitaria]TWT66167.1 2-(R)-hydroxypropyl-CoM dehydrogenase [Allorhodopirellula solitaria]
MQPKPPTEQQEATAEHAETGLRPTPRLGKLGAAAIVSGGSSGLGLTIARVLLARGYAVTILGRDRERLAAAGETLSGDSSVPSLLHTFTADATSKVDLNAAVDSHMGRFGRIDVLVNVVGRSDRGRTEELDPETLRELFEANVISALIGSQACLPGLRQTHGTIVNIGSLASRVAPRYLGGYVTVKHALAGMTRQMRLECEAEGVHVGLVCPGPIASSRPPNRYGVTEESALPASAAQPGGGAKLKLLSPDEVAQAVMRCIEKREIEIILPWKTRCLMCIDAISPRLADWILSRKSAPSE